jgi:Co/Zn/Cd efflux system component
MSVELIRQLREPRDIRWGVGVYLLAGPRTLAELKASCQDTLSPFVPKPEFYVRGRWKARSLERLPDDLAGLVSAGWVLLENDRYALTEQGRHQVQQRMEKLRSATAWMGGRLQFLFQPQAASVVTLVVQIVLASFKLPAGLLSGSVGLLNDAADTLLDLLSGLLVYLGVRFNTERLVSILLVTFMLGTGSFTLYEAVQRFFVPFVPHVDWFPFAAAIVSALAGLVLWTYQRYVGLESGLMAFITESVDSRNHVFVALSVTAGLAASLFNFGLLDMLVGLGVAVLILWSGLELAVDMARSSAAGGPAVSRYGFWMRDVYQHARNAHLRELMLYLVEHQEVKTEAELVERARQAFDYRNNIWMKLVGLDRQFADDEAITRSLNELVTRGLTLDHDPLALSPEENDGLTPVLSH